MGVSNTYGVFYICVKNEGQECAAGGHMKRDSLTLINARLFDFRKDDT